MVTDTEIDGNPFASPKARLALPGRSKILRWLILCVAVLFVSLSLPFAWLAFELANQEYLHLWNSNRSIHDIEFNGSPISIGTAIQHALTAVLILWLLAAATIIVPRFVSRRRLRKVRL